ncbi:1-deoxy-D-xylulose-5-phosphate reductoisomerase [Acidobacteriota bacterium]
MKNISILGSTGSIGCSTLEVVDELNHKFKVVGLSAGRNSQLLEKQVKKFKPKIVSLDRKEDAERFRLKFSDLPLLVTSGQEGAEELAKFDENDIVVSAITGISGLRPTLAAVKSGKKIALANKESMVVAGPLIQEAARCAGAQIIPVDSEHSGVFQCLNQGRLENVKKVTLTASGGPFFHTSIQEMRNRTLEEALNHPRWKMGEKVTIDSATLMNKGLELIEARWLFGLNPQQLEILIHPQSIVHSLVEMNDGSVLAQLSPTDMRFPIQYALTHPQREKTTLPSLDLSQIQTLEFYKTDTEKFPLVSLARQVLEEGGSLTVALNAANEMAVEAFLKRELIFNDISDVIIRAVENHHKRKVESLGSIFDVDRETRLYARNLIKQRL